MTATACADLLEALSCRRSGCECVAAIRRGRGTTHCPAHEDGKPSLSVNNGSSVDVVFCCQSGCSQDDVIVALVERGLWSKPEPNGHSPFKPAPEIAARHDYRDEAGELLYQTVRYRPKRFAQRRPDGRGGWAWNLDGVRRVLYRLPQLLAADPSQVVHIVEGEKDVDRLVSLGLVATTNVGGAGGWRPEYSEYLKGHHVRVYADNDDSGRAHVQQVARSLWGSAASIRVIELPGLPEKGDVSDWLDAGGSCDELLAIGDSAPTWKRSAEDSPPGVAVPQIHAGELDLRVITGQAWEALARANEQDPFLFRHGGVPVRIEQDDHGRPLFRDLTPDRVRYELARAAEFYTSTDKGRKVVLPPKHVSLDLLATPNAPLPVVTRITECPTFGPNGDLQTKRGYHAASQTYCALPAGLEIPPVPARPTLKEMARARHLLLHELLVDFPFVSQSDRANAVGLNLLPLVRDLIDGPTPLHMFEAPSPGTGKGLCAEASLRSSCGRSIGAIAQAKDTDEWRKRITAMLRDGHPAVLLDNITRALDAGALSMALTIPYWTDRILGLSTTVRLPVRCVWVATANNPAVSTEIARRTIRIRLDPHVDKPWERQGWRHPELLAWVDDHRGELVWAGLVLVQAWLAAGRPKFSGKALGSYERWSRVIGGILEHARIIGFIGNQAEFYEQADIEAAVWRGFVEAWWTKYNSAEVGTTELFPVAVETDGLDLGSGHEKSQKTIFGKALARQRDRVVGDYRIVRGGTRGHTRLWRLLPTSSVSARYAH